jgi:hypothetical protein
VTVAYLSNSNLAISFGDFEVPFNQGLWITSADVIGQGYNDTKGKTKKIGNSAISFDDLAVPLTKV